MMWRLHIACKLGYDDDDDNDDDGGGGHGHGHGDDDDDDDDGNGDDNTHEFMQCNTYFQSLCFTGLQLMSWTIQSTTEEDQDNNVFCCFYTL